jgi:hypothetical protein
VVAMVEQNDLIPIHFKREAIALIDSGLPDIDALHAFDSEAGRPGILGQLVDAPENGAGESRILSIQPFLEAR